MESLALALLGGVVGIAGGVGLITVTQAIAQNFGLHLTIPVHLPGVLAAAGSAALVG